MTNIRKVAKGEKPRPLKREISTEENFEMVLNKMDLVVQKLNGTAVDSSIGGLVTSLCESLKLLGPQLENTFKDQLDRCYVALRNGCRDDRVPLTSRYRLLEVIELRAMNWQPNENLVAFYKQKLAQAENEDSTLEKYPGIDNVCQYIETRSPSFVANDHSTTGFVQTPYHHIVHQSRDQIRSSSPSESPPALFPGEVMKSSGKYAAPFRQSGKGQLKDEVVIRNADSGKVMGLKGRRVHMIEELSETVVSFQRVSPGARERLVQITGMSEENVSQAKQLIEETIRRNASPVRSEDRNASLRAVARPFVPRYSLDDSYQSNDFDGNNFDDSCFEGNFEDYRYTVSHGEDFVCISGSNLDLVKTAKLVLEEYFSAEKQLYASSNSSFDRENSPSATSESSSVSSTPKVSFESPKTEKEIPKNGTVTVLRQPIIPFSSKEMIESIENDAKGHENGNRTRRQMFAKTNAEKTPADLTVNTPKQTDSGTSTSPSTKPKQSESPPAVPSRRSYTREFLIGCAASPLCRKVPECFCVHGFWSSTIARKDIKYADPDALLRPNLNGTFLTTNGSAGNDNNGNLVANS